MDEVRFDELRMLTSNFDESEAQVQNLFETAWPLFIKNAKYEIPDSAIRLGNAIAEKGMPKRALELNSPHVLMHGDYRVDNMLFTMEHGRRKCIVLDWEDISLGCGLTDVAWLVAGCVPNVTIAMEKMLLKHYYDVLVRQGVSNYDFDNCLDDYRKSMVERFVQGVLSGTIYEPTTISDEDARFATAVGGRYVKAAVRLKLSEFI